MVAVRMTVQDGWAPTSPPPAPQDADADRPGEEGPVPYSKGAAFLLC